MSLIAQTLLLLLLGGCTQMLSGHVGGRTIVRGDKVIVPVHDMGIVALVGDGVVRLAVDIEWREHAGAVIMHVHWGWACSIDGLDEIGVLVGGGRGRLVVSG